MKRVSADFEAVLSSDSVSDLIDIAKRYPQPTREENLELVRRYKSGDEEVREEIVIRNLLLVIKEARKYVNRSKSYQLCDLVNEGVIGFLESLESFNPDVGTALSTFVVPKINWSIRRSINDNDDMIRKPVYFKSLALAYSKLIDEVKATGKGQISDEYLKNELGVSDETLELLKQNQLMNPKSLDEATDDDSESKLGDFIGTIDNHIENFLNFMTDKVILVYLKAELTPIQYYVLYHSILADERLSLSDIGKKLGISRERVRQIFERTIAIIKSYFTKEGFRSELYLDKCNVELANILPYDEEAFLRFNFLRGILEDDAIRLYKLWLTRLFEYDIEYYASVMNKTTEEIKNLGNVIKFLVELLKSDSTYEIQKEKIRQKYKTNILSLEDLNADANQNNYFLRLIAQRYDSIDFNEIVEEIQKKGISVDRKTLCLVHDYFQKSEKLVSVDEVEREVNALLFGFKSSTVLPVNRLYETLVQNKDKFLPAQYAALETFVFHTKSQQEFARKFPNFDVSNVNYVREKLERLHYNVRSYSVYKFSKEKYLALRDRACESIEEFGLRCLDLYYGVDCKPYTLSEIAEITGKSETDIWNLNLSSRKKLLRLYLKENPPKDVDKDIYLEYLDDPMCSINSEHRKMAIMYLREGLTYEEVGKKFGLSRYEANNRILDTIRKIDMFRYGILESYPRTTKEEKLEYVTSMRPCKGKNLLLDYLNGNSMEDIAKKYETSIDKVITSIKKLHTSALAFKLKKQEITLDDVTRELNCHQSEVILSEEEFKVLSLRFGVKSRYNLEGRKYSFKETVTALKMTEEAVSRYRISAFHKIAGKKVGYFHPPLIYMSRRDVAELLDDIRLPISEQDRQIMCSLYGLGGYSYKRTKELCKLLGYSEKSLTRKVQRIFLTMFKYKNGEITPAFSFEHDVKPYLKYFSKSDQKILREHLEEGLSYKKIAELNGLTFDQVVYFIRKLKAFLKDYRAGDISMFDYDYYFEHQFDEDILYYGDLDLARKVIYMFFEERKYAPTIIDELSLDISESYLKNVMWDYILAVMKKQAGVKKAREFTYEEICEYYSRHESEMTASHKVYYHRYFNQRANRKFSINQLVSTVITMDLIMERFPDKYIRLESVNRGFILDFIHRFGSAMSRRHLETLEWMFGINNRDFMSGKDQMKVLKFLIFFEQERIKTLSFKR